MRTLRGFQLVSGDIFQREDDMNPAHDEDTFLGFDFAAGDRR